MDSLPDYDAKIRALVQVLSTLEAKRAYHHTKLKNNPDYIAYNEALKDKNKAVLELVEYHKSQHEIISNMF